MVLERQQSTVKDLVASRLHESENAAQPGGNQMVEEALKRKEGLLNAQRVRVERLELQMEELKDNLKREEHLRREAEEKAEQAQNELAAFHQHAAQGQEDHEPLKRPSELKRLDTFAEHGTNNDAELLARIMEQREDVQRSHDRADSLYSEMQVMRGHLAETQEKLEKANEAKAELATKLDEMKKNKDADDPSAAPAAAAPAVESAQKAGHPRKPTDREMEALLPAEAYRAMQEGRVEASTRIRELEDELAALKAIDGSAAREREKAAHQSMADRCARVSAALRIVESQLSRTQAVLNPTRVQLTRCTCYCTSTHTAPSSPPLPLGDA